jgi:hypothetical protein
MCGVDTGTTATPLPSGIPLFSVPSDCTDCYDRDTHTVRGYDTPHEDRERPGGVT